MEVERTFDLLDRYSRLYTGKDDALCCKIGGNWVKFSTKEYIDNSYNFSFGLLEKGLKKGDRIITITNNRPEWNFADMGMSMIGVIHVPVFPSLSISDYQYIIEHCEASMILISDKKMLRNVIPAVALSGRDIPVYSFDDAGEVKNWKEILETGKSVSEKYASDVEKIKATIKPDDFASLIYTSGTTGRPKGVILTHRNIVSNFLAAADVFRLNKEDSYLSILPLCHVGGRMGNYQTQYSGSSIYYAESMGTIASNMAEIRPDGFDAVPRILEKFYDVIISKGNKLSGMKKKLFFWAVKLGLKYQPHGENGLWYELRLMIADRLIFSKWRQALGDRVKIVGCGGASLQPRLEKIFWAAGIKIINMYGLTETSPIITINRTEKGMVKLGSVGMTIEGVEIKIAGDGEILCKGPNVTPGYYKDPDLTKEAFDEDGWFHTGDIGHIEDGKFLMVTDRKKEIFKLSNGKFIAPQVIENLFKESPLIDQIIVIGEHQKFASALIMPNFSYFNDWKNSNQISFETYEELVTNQKVQSLFLEEIEKLNKRLSAPERIARFRLVHDE
ncbi:MAG TPA: long-chain fatty acid--CoA ligase [Bacteroidales bacterium]|nr:long-chain fatty acid--CoA ligase [Bacteroidales bacterium]HPJ59598.1 long-chain fatty acid--CoA ligase [Bacteroidales bacterium]HPR12941.1 long-chain fatty acid--CoA ligase [Bacteroidales bacterium]